eukprot:g13226.t1
MATINAINTEGKGKRAKAKGATSHLATKKSCDLCVSRKRKCDGATPCNFCVSRGRECHYSQRRPNRPRGYAKRLGLAMGGGAGGHGCGHAHARAWHGRGDVQEKELAAMQMQMRVQYRQQDTPTVGWKRVRLSASPATGLVGMEENAFLGWFFDCLGFLPLTDEKLVRGAIMDIFLGFSSEPEPEAEAEAVAKADRSDNPAPPAHAANEEAGMEMGVEVEMGAGAAAGGGAGGGQEQQRGSDAASTCTLWCTVAMGALVQGQPPERVAPYMRLAWMSLSQCFDTVTAGTARAFTMMAYLYNFLRNDHKFYRYLLFARGVINRLPDSTPQKQEIVDLLARANDTRIFHTAALEPGELDDYCEDDNRSLQVPDVVNKSALCRLLLEADRRMIKAFLRDHKAQVAVPLGDHDDPQASCLSSLKRETPPAARPGVTAGDQGLGHAEREGRGDGVGGCGGVGAGVGGDDSIAEISARTGEISMSSNKMNAEADPTCPGGETSACIERAREVLSRIQDTSKIPEVGAGVGGLIYNAILGYLDIVTGDTELKIRFAKLQQCAKVFVRYPGLCRFSTWLHLSHCLLSVLAELDDTRPYEDLRNAYNSVRSKGSVEAPPHERWTMVGFCDHIFCRSIDHLDKRHNCTPKVKHDGIKHDGDAGTAGDTHAAQPDKQNGGCLHKHQDHDLAVACEGESTHLPHRPNSLSRYHSVTSTATATADPLQMLVLPNSEWSEDSLETSPGSALGLQSVDVAPMAGLAGIGPIEASTSCQSVLSIAGLSGVGVGVTSRPAGLGSSSFNSTGRATFGNGKSTLGQSPAPTPPALTVAGSSLALEGCSTAPIPTSSQQQQWRVMGVPAQVTDTTTRQATAMFSRKVAYWGGHTAGGAVMVGGGVAGGDGNTSVEQDAFGLKFFWPTEP